MPPKARITKEMILNTVLDITRETGFESVNARSIAKKLQCSTQPVFTCYKNMDDLKNDFLDFAFEFYNDYVKTYRLPADTDPLLLFPLSYIAFADEETNLFKLLFISEMDLDMKEAKDFYNESGNETKVQDFAAAIGIDPEQAKSVFLDLFLYSHGIAVLTAARKLSLDMRETEQMTSGLLSALIKQIKTDTYPNTKEVRP